MALAAAYGGLPFIQFSFIIQHTHIPTLTFTHYNRTHTCSFASLSGPLFNMFVGLGLGITWWTVKVIAHKHTHTHVGVIHIFCNESS